MGEYGEIGERGQKGKMLQELRIQCQVFFEEQCPKFVGVLLQRWEEHFLEAFLEQYQEVLGENARLREELGRANDNQLQQAVDQGRSYKEMNEKLTKEFEAQKRQLTKEIGVQKMRADNLEREIGSRKGAGDVNRVDLGKKSRVSEEEVMNEQGTTGGRELMDEQGRVPEVMVQERKLAMEGEVQRGKADNLERGKGSRKGAGDVNMVDLGKRSGVNARRVMNEQGTTRGRELMDEQGRVPDVMVQERKLAMEGEVQRGKAGDLEREMSSRKGARDVDRVNLGGRFGISGERKMGGQRVSGGRESMEGELIEQLRVEGVMKDDLVERGVSGVKGAGRANEKGLMNNPQMSKKGEMGEWKASEDRVLLPLEAELSSTEWREREKQMRDFTWPEEKVFPEFEEFYEAMGACVTSCLANGVPDKIVAASLNGYLLKAPSASKYATFSQQQNIGTTAGVLGALRETNFEYNSTTASERFQKMSIAEGEEYATFMARLKNAYRRFNVGIDVENDMMAKRRIKKRFFEGARIHEAISVSLRACDRLSDIVRYAHEDMRESIEIAADQAEARWWGEELHPPPLMQGIFY